VRFEDFVLQFDASARGGFRARVLKSPFGEGVVGFSLPSLAGAQPALPGDPGISRGLEGPVASQAAGDLSPASFRDLGLAGAAAGLGHRPPAEIGADLYRSVFQGQVRSLLDKSRGQLEKSTDLGIRLKIKLDPNDEETGALADLPWELLCDSETEDFFALSRQTSLVRYLDVPRSSQPILFTPPLRILAVGASPHGLPPLDLAAEERDLQELDRSSSGVEVRFLGHASAGAVRTALAGDTYNVLHFMGHGTFDRASGEGMLVFEGEDGAPDLVSGRAFATKLRDLRSLGVVVLNACNTARAGQQGGGNPFRGVATALVQGGVPAVVAMQRPISDRAAISFSTALYRHLARGDSIDEALTEGRQAIHSAKPDSFEWATPVLFLRIPEGNVFVARPAAPAEEPKPEAPPVVSGPVPVSNRRGWAIKIAVGAAGAVLVIFVLYTKLHSPASGPVQPAGGPETQTTAQPVQPQTKETAKTSPRTNTVIRPDAARSTGPGGDSKGVAKPPVSITPQGSSAAPAPAPTQASKPAEPPPAATADLSRLEAQAVSIAQRSGGGLRVTVQFRNSGDRPLSVVLDADNSVLNDDKGGSNGIMGSNLPKRDSNPRLDLAAGASVTSTFDFPMPLRGSRTFYLNLLSVSGASIQVGGSPMTLPGSS
jgi:hypothetical protein